MDLKRADKYIVEYYVCKNGRNYVLEVVDEEKLNELKDLESKGKVSIISIVHMLYGELR